MSWWDYLQQALEEQRHHKLRTLLTLLGMIFGVGAVIAMLSIGEGAEREALQMIDAMGLRNLIVESKEMDDERLKEMRKHSIGLTLQDLRAAQDTLPFIEHISAEKEVKTYLVFSESAQADVSVMGVTPGYFSLSSFSAADGALFDDGDDERYEQVAVLGAQAATTLFPQGDAIGKLVKVNHVWLRVKGVLADHELKKNEFEGIKLGSEKTRIFIPLQTALKRFKFKTLESELSTFRLQLQPNVDAVAAARTLTHLLNRRHNSVDDFDIVVPAKLMAQHRQTRRIFTIVMSCVAGISLLVGGIGIMNIMLASVLERTREIGLLRAIGATRRDILRQFIVESFTVTAMGGLLGIALGFALAAVIAYFADWAFGFSLIAIFVSVGVCAVIGIVFGMYPAIKASQLDPIVALQRE